MNEALQKKEINSQVLPLSNDMDKKEDTITLFGLRFNRVTQQQAMELVIDAAQYRKRGFVTTPNVNMLTLLPSKPELRELFNQASFQFVDGWPIVWASNRLEKQGLPERVAGSDLFPLICESAEKKGLTLAMIGAAEGVGDEASRRLKISYPNLNIVGAYCPPMEAEFSAKSTADMVEFCNTRKPDILLLGMGIPKQEKWISANIDNLDIGVALCFGGVIDFAAGKIKRSPQWVVTIGMEWLWRFCMSPSQYWERTILRFPLFFPMFLKEIITRRR